MSNYVHKSKRKRREDKFQKEMDKQQKITKDYYENLDIPECPKCKSESVAKIIYGLPYMKFIEQYVNAGRVYLGGCQEPLDDTQWKCNNCGFEF